MKWHTHGVGYIPSWKHMERDTYGEGNTLGVGNIRSGIHTRGMQTEWDTRNEINTELNTHGMDTECYMLRLDLRKFN